MNRNQTTIKPLTVPILLSTLVITLAQSPVTTAQALVLEEVIVTSQIRVESLQDVPVSVSAVSGSKLMEAGIDKIEDLQAYVPNLTMSETAIGTNIYIRGIGSGINQGFEQSTGMYVDGVSYGRAQLSRAPFLDLERVEVLRGPQNILLGKNSIAGALNITTAKPGDEFEGLVSALYEPDHGEQVFDVVFSGPLTDTLGARLAYRNRSMDGYIENLTSGDDEPNRDEETVRFIADLEVSADLDITAKYEHSDFDITGRQIEIQDEETSTLQPFASLGWDYSDILFGAFGQDASVLNNTADFQRSSNGDFSKNSTDNFTLTANYVLGGEQTVTVIVASNAYDYKELCDCDFTGANVFSLLSEEDYEQYSFEARIVSAVGQTFEYIAGIYYQDSELEFQDQFFVASNSILVPAVNTLSPGAGTLLGGTAQIRDFQQDTELWSVFSQLTWNIRDNLRLTFGGRFSTEEKDASRVIDLTNIDGSAINPGVKPFVTGVYTNVFRLEPHSINNDRSEDNFAPLITAEWDLNNETMVYATASQGFKSGGFDVRSNAAPSSPLQGTFEFQEEEATSLELGAKATLLDGAAELNAALFYTEYDDLQISIFDGGVGFNVGNAARAETQGLEIDGRWRLTESLTLVGAVALLDFEFKDFKNGQCNQGQLPDAPILSTPNPFDGSCDFTGKTNQYVADWSGNISLDYFTTMGSQLALRSTLDLIFTDDYNPSQTLDPALDQSAYTKVNARIALSNINDVWVVALVGKNLTDEDIATYGNATPLAFNIFQARSRYVFYERDRSIALQGTYRF